MFGSFRGREERKNVLHVLVELHRLTSHYPANFAERNVVCLDGKYMLIDFHELIKHGYTGLLPNIKYPLVTISNVSYLALSYPPKPIIDALLPDWFDPNLRLSSNKVVE
ncbi:hypothetical protein EV421DRAFT_1910142 [Armillaria borealis]|uniref:Uncharacterized protein n=1 Tax=Armillaria borealis TaxID=47425 RepID=A0AA39J187_9AGAR|nr:hypothetical protein EV421DRAFT_1910142 [Armillaria borealis]